MGKVWLDANLYLSDKDKKIFKKSTKIPSWSFNVFLISICFNIAYMGAQYNQVILSQVDLVIDCLVFAVIAVNFAHIIYLSKIKTKLNKISLAILMSDEQIKVAHSDSFKEINDEKYSLLNLFNEIGRESCFICTILKAIPFLLKLMIVKSLQLGEITTYTNIMVNFNQHYLSKQNEFSFNRKDFVINMNNKFIKDM